MKCPQCHFENPDDSSYCSKCGTQILLSAQIPSSKTETLQMPTEELSRGAVFAGRYEIIEELGQGGMGKVYRVFDRKLDGEVGLAHFPQLDTSISSPTAPGKSVPLSYELLFPPFLVISFLRWRTVLNVLSESLVHLRMI